MSGFDQLVSVNFQGIVVVFGRSTASTTRDIYYNVLGPDTDNDTPILNWSGFKKLDFTAEIRQVGMSIITLEQDAATLTLSTAPFRVITDQSYISVVQQSAKGTLYVNRFRLLKTQSGSNQKTTIYSLAPAWEVRYSRSGKEDVPADASDTQSFLDPNGVPFLEPSFELAMIDTINNGEFEVLLLPIAGSTAFAWQFIVLDRTAASLRFYNFPATATGLFDTVGKTAPAPNYKIPPDSVCTFTSPGSSAALPTQGPPRAVVYTKHEKVVQPDGTSIGVKRASRVMLAQPVLHGQTPASVTIDSAVATDGKMARLDGSVAVSQIQPAVFDLVFQQGAYVQLNPPGGANPLAITGPYSISFLIAPAAQADGLLVIGGAAGGDPNKAAPFIRIVNSDKIETGFGNGTAVVSCRTLHQTLVPGTWTSIRIDYAGKGANPFKMTVNGSVVPLTACSTDADPSGTPIALIGAPTSGFAGALDQVEIEVGGTKVLTLPCNTVDYTVNPPTTPNTASTQVTATVFGAKNEPSTSPVNVDMSGEFHIDDKGITFYAGLADFIQPKSPACLIDGSDGLLHLYYQGTGDSLSVAQFSTSAARATFYTAWTTDWGTTTLVRTEMSDAVSSGRYLGWMSHEWARVSANVLRAPDSSQSGFLNFVAHRVGTYMNGTQITVAASSVSPLLCDVTVAAPKDVGTETWKGLPRNIDTLSLIWNGAASNSPDAQDVLNQSRPYFDYSGTVPAVLCPSTNEAGGSYFLFLSVPSYSVRLASVKVDAGGATGLVNIGIEISAPPNWQPGELLRQSWPDVPADSNSLLNVFAGKTTRYPYNKVTTPGSRAYGLALTTTRSDDQTQFLLLFVKNELTDFSISVADGSQPVLCNVTICGFSLPGVPRRQGGFAEVINGADKIYHYPDGYAATIAAMVFALPNGLAADVVNLSGTPAAGGALAYAGLLRILFNGAISQTISIATLARTSAAIIQSASLSFNGNTMPIRGSMLFGAVVVDRPTNGGVGRLSNTAAYTGGVAPVLMPGVNGGWMPVSPRFSLEFNATNQANYVGFSVDKNFSPANRLAINSDLTLQCWLAPRRSSNVLQARALTYNVLGNLAHPALPCQYMMGLERGPGLSVGPNTYFTRGFNFTPPDLTVQVYVKLTTRGVSGTVLTISQVMGSAVYATLSIDAFGKANLSILDGADTVQTANPLPSGVWVCLTAVVANAGQGNVILSLFVDEGAPVTKTVANSFSGQLGQLTVGSQVGKGILASLNGVAFWQRALSVEEVRVSFAFGFPDNDPLLGIRWNLTEGAGTHLMNSAVTGPAYDADLVNPLAQSWDRQGAFEVPYAGRNDLILISNRIIRGWTNVALSSRQGYALALNGQAYGQVEDGSPFNPGSVFALEAWILPGAVNTRQVIIEKPGSYSLFINTLGQLVLQVTVSQASNEYDKPPPVFVHEIKAPIQAGKTSYVAVNFMTGTTKNDQGSKEYVAQKYFIVSSLFINGVSVANTSKYDYPSAISVENRKSSFYLGMSGDRTFYFNGKISHVRVWNKTIDQPWIAATNDFRLTPTAKDGLIASWDFDDMSGMVVTDLTGQNNLQLSSNQLWTLWQDVAQASIFVNGSASLPRRARPADVGDYQDQQFTLGGVLASGAPTSPYTGQMDDIRLFSTRLTEQQLAQSMNNVMIGTETTLAGYWRVDAGSGPTLFDTTGRGNNGKLLPASAPPLWRFSTAPIQNEGQSVLNALGGTPDYLVATIDSQPSMIEFASAQLDAYGKLYSIMRRGYFYHAKTGENELEDEFKVGDLDMLFVGQVQSKPSVVGYIEGGPPIPSENQTLAYWSSDGGSGPVMFYANVSTVTYQESETKTWSFSATQSSTFNGAFNIKGGFYLKGKSAVSAGLGAESEEQTVERKIKLGLKGTLSGDLGSSESVDQSHTSNVSLTTSMTPPGQWEPADALLNPVVGRRYIQNNVGLALVKSATADLYMLAIKGTQTPVGYVTVPNKTIPVDTNLIDFPINPKYVKNGTLDGKVGLVVDPDWPHANDERGSYFRPIEAYNLKRSIEKEEQILQAYYAQFDVNQYRLLAKYESVKDKLKENPAYDFSKKVNKRSIYCNYVWSAVGGLHREEHSVANSYSETYTGASSLKFAAGFEISADIGTPFGGYYIETDAMLGNTWTMTATRSEQSANGFQLLCTVQPTNFLRPPIIEQGPGGQLIFKGYASSVAPGKVDAYRFMSFLLAPSATNFTSLKRIVDPNWLQNSTSASAAAMREALMTPTEPWRVLYRTTFVSRVPASFQPVKDETNAPNIVPPANLPSNDWLVRIIADQLKTPNPTPLEIGAAIDMVLGSPGDEPGLLKTLIPWWADFYAAARQFGTESFRELAELRVDLLEYMVSKYAAEQYALGLS